MTDLLTDLAPWPKAAEAIRTHGWTPDAYDLITAPCRDVLGIPAKWDDRGSSGE